MKNLVFLMLIIGLISCYPAEKRYFDYPISQVNLNHVELTDVFC